MEDLYETPAFLWLPGVAGPKFNMTSKRVICQYLCSQSTPWSDQTELVHHFCTIVTISKYEEKNLHCSNLTISISLKQSSYDQVAAAVIEYESNQRFSYNYLEMHQFYNEVWSSPAWGIGIKHWHLMRAERRSRKVRRWPPKCSRLKRISWPHDPAR